MRHGLQEFALGATSVSVRPAIWLNAWASDLAERTRRSSTRAVKSPAAMAWAACST